MKRPQPKRWRRGLKWMLIVICFLIAATWGHSYRERIWLIHRGIAGWHYYLSVTSGSVKCEGANSVLGPTDLAHVQNMWDRKPPRSGFGYDSWNGNFACQFPIWIVLIPFLVPLARMFWFDCTTRRRNLCRNCG